MKLGKDTVIHYKEYDCGSGFCDRHNAETETRKNAMITAFLPSLL